ncbi:glycosyltransferase [Methanonatronarchaeum sp. AMET6-2]|uniref:glycosyltransferase n=1 Tax=Methanonatronarchaeum sp. AMET6-2 TaxID=2933293 RepID=UPI001FF5F55B|nr:glycosyltransferase [Methanonatronarchaeum sp. AMET6-2]UOY10301.1 glycosyltransferase [Methanonatronarchaeum sp. AMET6-2]
MDSIDLALVGRYFNERTGGLGVYSKEILSGLIDDERFNIDIVSSNDSGWVGYFLYTTLKIKKKLPNESDVYHALSPLESIWCPKEKTVTTFHDLMPWLYADELYNNPFIAKIAKEHFKFAAKKGVKSRRIICNSEQTKNELLKHTEAEENKIDVVRLGISNKIKPEQNTVQGKTRFGSLGVLHPRKRFDILINEFIKTNIDAELIIGGDGYIYNDLEKLAEKDDRVKLLGFIPEKQKNKFLNDIDIFVYPSKLEGYGLPIIEAMATKTPVITLEDSIIPKDVKNKTDIVKKENLAEKIEKQKLEQNIEENYNFANQHKWSKTIKKTIQIYKEII